MAFDRKDVFKFHSRSTFRHLQWEPFLEFATCEARGQNCFSSRCWTFRPVFLGPGPRLSTRPSSWTALPTVYFDDPVDSKSVCCEQCNKSRYFLNTLYTGHQQHRKSCMRGERIIIYHYVLGIPHWSYAYTYSEMLRDKPVFGCLTIMVRIQIKTHATDTYGVGILHNCSGRGLRILFIRAVAH